MFKASDVKDLREKTGAGMLDCKKALEATEGNMEKAIDWLREKGIAKAAKKESRIAAEGLCQIKIAGNDAVILEGRRSDYPDPITVTAPTAKAGYRFVGWKKYTATYKHEGHQDITVTGYEAIYDTI